MNDQLTTPEPEHEEESKYDNEPWNQVEKIAFPPEFLDCIAETSFHAVTQYLKKTGVAEDALRLLDVFYCLMMNHADAKMSGGKTTNFDNGVMIDNVKDASHLIVKLGGVFYTNGSTTYPRTGEIGEKVEAQIEDIFQRSETKKPKRKGKKS